MSSTSSPPDSSNIVHGVFPTQALRVGDGRRATAERLPEDTTRSAEQGSTALATSGEGDAAGPPTEEAQACFAFIVSDDEGPRSEQAQAPSAAADALPRPAQAMVGEAVATPPADGAFDLPEGDQNGDGRAALDAMVVLPEPPEDATSASAADAEPYTLEARTDEAVREEGSRRTAGGDLAGEPAAHTGEPREIDLDEVAASGIDPHEIAAHEIDPPEIDPPEIDPDAVVLPELASYQLASHEAAAEVIAAEGASEEIAAREGAAPGVAALGTTQHEGDPEIAADEEASYQGTEIVAARPMASPIAPPRAAEQEPLFPTLARASLARTAHPGAPTHGAQRPLTRALDTAARLAADANAAAAALDSLKRLLQQGLPASGQAEIARAAPAAEHRAQHRPAPLPPRPPPPPPPERPMAVAPLAAVQRAPLPPADRARFDVRGFFAGVALSCAIGIILYLFMTAG